MRCIIPQITWNSCQQILSLDFDQSCKAENGFYRLVTVGADTNLLVWHLRDADTLKPSLTCVAELNRHQKAVNTVRFSPDGNWIASGDDDAYIILWRNDRKSPEEEVWSVEKLLRKHLGDVTDLSWSLDSNYLLSSSVDSTAVCWDVKKGTSKHIWTEHGGFVQGVSFDPSGEVAATISIDRSLRLFDVNTGKLKTKASKYQGWIEGKPEENEEETPTPSANDVNEKVNSEGTSVAKKIVTYTVGNNIFQDDDLATFCRRLSFSPRGEFLMVPAGSIPSERKIVYSKSQQDSPLDPAAKKIKLKPAEKPPATENNHAIIVFCRNDFSVPCAIIPTGTSYSVACRFCPVYFQHADQDFTYGEDISNPVKKDQRRIYCTGKLKQQIEEHEDALLEAPYRMVYAVATNNSVLIGTTDKIEPLAIVRNIHFARLTDLAWSPDGRILVTSSTDGYCSIITFDEKELGLPLTGEIPQLLPSSFAVPVKEVKVKEPKQKVGSVKKDKTPGTKKEKTPGAKRDKTPGTKREKTPGTKNDKTPGSNIKDPKEKAKTGKRSKSSCSTPESGKGKNKNPKPTKLRMDLLGFLEKTPKANLNPADVVKPLLIAESNAGELPNPYVHLTRLPTTSNETGSVPAENPTNNVDDVEILDEEKSPAPIKFIPQKNTLDRWIIKKKQDNTSTPTKSSHSAESILVNNCSSPTDVNGTDSAATSTSKIVSPGERSKPTDIVTIDLESDSDNSKPSTTEIPTDSASTSSAAVVTSASESPKPIQKKPRRVQLITLSSSAVIPKTFSEGPKEPTDSKSE